jgi:hypothetical protein
MTKYNETNHPSNLNQRPDYNLIFKFALALYWPGTGVEVPEFAALAVLKLPGEGTSPSGFLRYAAKNFLQFDFDGTKWPGAAVISITEQARRDAISYVLPLCSSTLPLLHTCTNFSLRSSVTITSPLPMTWSVGVEKEGEIMCVARGSVLMMKPETAIQNLLLEVSREGRKTKGESVEIYVYTDEHETYNGGWGAFPSTKNGGYRSGRSSYDVHIR